MRSSGPTSFLVPTVFKFDGFSGLASWWCSDYPAACGDGRYVSTLPLSLSTTFAKHHACLPRQMFQGIHSPTVFSMLKPNQTLGPVDVSTIPASERATESEDDIRVKKARENLPPLSSIVNLDDMEEVAKSVLSSIAWSYYFSSADGEMAFKNNLHAWKHYWFRPRV